MNILEFSVRTDAEGAEALAAAFNEYAYGGSVIEQTVTPEPNENLDVARPFTVRAFLLMDAEVETKRRALEETVWHFAQLRPISEPRVRELAEEDWAHAWKKHYTVQHLGARVVVKPSWLEYVPGENEIVVELDPGMAFGTGLHPTTRLCVRGLEQNVFAGARVLDVGTGSGILSIVAAKLGAREILAVDIDPVAVETARENVARNRVESIIRVESGTARAETNGAFDLVVANILAEVIVELAPALVANLAPHGVLITSGILAEKAEMVRERLRELGLFSAIENEEDWVVLTSKK